MRSQEAARLERQAAASGGAAGALVAGSLVCLMGFAAAGITLLVKGIDDLSWGKNRKEGF